MPKISLAFLPPEQTPQPLRFERPLPLAPAALARAGAGGRAPGHSSRRVAPRQASCASGARRATIPPFCFVLEVAAPGLLVVKHRRTRSRASSSTSPCSRAIRSRSSTSAASSLPDCPALLTSLLGFDARTSASDDSTCWSSSRCRCARTAAAARCWSCRPARERVARVDRAADRLRRARRRSPSSRSLLHARGRPTSALARLAGGARPRRRGHRRADRGRRRDGDHRSLRAAGVRRQDRAGAQGWPRVEQVIVTEPIEGGDAGDRASRAARRHPPSLGRAVRAGSARRRRAGRVAGRPLHDLRVVAVREHGPRAPRRVAAAVAPS